MSYFEKLRRVLEQSDIDLSSEPDDIDLDEAESRELDLLQMSHNFVRPEHLIKWVKECINKHKNGVFLLQMERGMGKSVFTEKLDRLYKDPLKIDEDLDVRTYHFSRTQTAGIDDVYSKIEWQWSKEFGSSEVWQRIPHISDLTHSNPNMSLAEAFCAFLKSVRNHTEKKRHAKRILMVLDGLDEIVDGKTWELFPSSDMLPEGVYILLTSRNLEEEGVPKKLSGTTGELDIRESMVVSKEDGNNEIFLRSYIKSTTLRNLSENDIELLLQKSDCRVLYLGMLCRLTEWGIAIEKLRETGPITEVYLSVLDECYGEKESIRMRELLALLSTLGEMEPLLLKEIGGLSAEGKLTLGIIGMIRDLSPMLKVMRSPEGNRYTIANPGLAEELRKQLPETEDVVTDMVQLGIDQIRTGYPIEYPSVEPVIAHITLIIDLLSNSLPIEKMKMLVDEGFLESFDSFSYNTLWDFDNPNRTTKAIKYYQQQVQYAAKEFGEENDITLRSKCSLANAYYEAAEYEDAEQLYKEIIETMLKNGSEDHFTMINCYNNLGMIPLRKTIFLRPVDRVSLAIEYFEKAKAVDYLYAETSDELPEDLYICIELNWVKATVEKLGKATVEKEELLSTIEEITKLIVDYLKSKKMDSNKYTLLAMKHLGRAYMKMKQYDNE